MLGDRDKALGDLFHWIGKSWKGRRSARLFVSSGLGSFSRARGVRSKDTYEKATSDDLKSLVPNSAELEAFIKAEARRTSYLPARARALSRTCMLQVPCLLRHLRETRPDVPFDRSCANPWPKLVKQRKGKLKGERHSEVKEDDSGSSCA